MHRLQRCARRSLPAVVKSEQPSGSWFFCGQVPSCANLLHSFVHKPSDPCWVFFERSARLGWAEEKKRNLLCKNEKTRSVRGKTGFMSEQQAGYSAVTNRLPRCFSVGMHASGKKPPASRCVVLRCPVLCCAALPGQTGTAWCEAAQKSPAVLQHPGFWRQCAVQWFRTPLQDSFSKMRRWRATCTAFHVHAELEHG